MKINGILALSLLLAGCSQLESFTQVGTNASTEEKFRACAISEASSKLQNGTLFNQTFTATKDEIVQTCLKKLAYDAIGFDSEASQIADSVLSQFRK